jgi:hypothetical protein
MSGAVDVRRLQLEDVLHALQGRERVEVGPQALEHGAPALGALVDEPEAELVVARGLDEQHAGAWVLGLVPRRLREELVRQGHSLLIDHVDPRR